MDFCSFKVNCSNYFTVIPFIPIKFRHSSGDLRIQTEANTNNSEPLKPIHLEATASHQRLGELDGLRAIAILLVAFLHIWQMSWLDFDFTIAGITIPLGMFPTTGYVGVDLFFFLSGFCVFYPFADGSKIILNRSELRHFYWRRGLKILPSYWLAIILVLIFLPNEITDLETAFRHIGTHLLFIHNWSRDTHGSILGVFWSLGVEVQFYLIFPLIATLYRKSPLATLGIACLIGYLFRDFAIHFSGDYFLMGQLPAVIDLFVIGMAAAHVVSAKTFSSRLIGAVSFIIGATLFLVLLYMAYQNRYTPLAPVYWQYHYRLIIGLSFFLVTIGLAHTFSPIRLLFDNALLRWVSAISYNFYIWHQVLARELIKLHFPVYLTSNPVEDHVWQWQFFCVALGVSMIVASVITYGFERPILKFQRVQK